MRLQHMPVYALAVAIAFAGGLWLGVPVTTLLLLAAVLVCPLMMLFMMRGMHRMHGDAGRHDTSHDQHDRGPRTPSHR